MRLLGAAVAFTLVLAACSTGSHPVEIEAGDGDVSTSDLRSDRRPFDSYDDAYELSDTAQEVELQGIFDVAELELSDEASYSDFESETDTCMPACAEKECGEDGCGGTCGECEEGSKCIEEGTCEQVPIFEGLLTLYGDAGVEPRNVVVDSTGNILVAAANWGSYLQVSDSTFSMTDAEKGLFLVKLNEQLDPLWWKPTGASSGGFIWGHDSLWAGPDETFIVASQFDKHDVVDLGGGVLPAWLQTDGFAGALTGDGEHLWSTSLAGVSDDYVAEVTGDGSGGAYLTGHTNSESGIDFGEDAPEIPPWADEYPYLIRYGATGTPIWSKVILSNQLEKGISVTTTTSGGVCWAVRAGSSFDLGGDTLTAVSDGDLVLATFAADGTHMWSKRFGVAGGFGVARAETALLADNSLILVGRLGAGIDLGCGKMLPNDGGNSVIAIAKLDSQGKCVWSKVLGNGLANWPGAETPGLDVYSIALDNSEQIYLGGTYTAPLDIGGGPLDDYAKGGFVAKLDDSGNHVWSVGLSSTVTSISIGPDGAVYSIIWMTDELEIFGDVYPNPSEIIDPNTGKPPVATSLLKLVQ